MEIAEGVICFYNNNEGISIGMLPIHWLLTTSLLVVMTHTHTHTHTHTNVMTQNSSSTTKTLLTWFCFFQYVIRPSFQRIGHGPVLEACSGVDISPYLTLSLNKKVGALFLISPYLALTCPFLLYLAPQWTYLALSRCGIRRDTITETCGKASHTGNM